MKAATMSARSGEHGENFEQVKRRFLLWRDGRKRGAHIPNELWAAAVGLAQEHGAERVAQELRVDLDGLKKRLDRCIGPVQSDKPKPQFVELFASPGFGAAPLCECVVEMENGRGAKMRIELNGRGLASLADLGSAFWSAA